MENFILNGGIAEIGNAGEGIGEIFFNTLKKLKDNKNTLIFDDATKQEYSAADVYLNSIRAALRLHALGVRQGDMIGIVSENRVEYIWTAIGCFYLGATINPLNPDYVTREIKHAFEISRPRFVIVECDKVSRVSEASSQLKHVPTLITFEDFQGEVDNDEKLKIVSSDPLKNIALVLCSSGTTGLPKGVSLSQEAIKNCLYHVNAQIGFGIDEKETLIAVLPFYHILGLLSVMASILYQAKVIVMRKFKPDAYIKAIEQHKVTKLFIVPPLALFLAKAQVEFDSSSIKDVICGAAPLGPEGQVALERKLGVPIRQAYGMTEACAISLSPRDGCPPGSAGALLVNVEAIVRDLCTGQSLGPGQTGELCMKSPCLMTGYLHNEQATKEAFDGDGFLRTGDIAYYDDKGFIFIVDRLKELIKYKGFQVPPAEIEDVLMTHEEIKDAAVVGIPDERAGELARAFVVKSEGSGLTPESVQEWVAKHVSMAKRLHGGVVFVSSIPKSTAGKILRRELKQMAQNN
ncbi:uncharacterized protein [Atheta coriaria]|uniref:uncharacterized protein n=1 Tax=Dalotia coriaria TaxID=877792 RepID=UPI0031F41207